MHYSDEPQFDADSAYIHTDNVKFSDCIDYDELTAQIEHLNELIYSKKSFEQIIDEVKESIIYLSKTAGMKIPEKEGMEILSDSGYMSLAISLARQEALKTQNKG